MAECVDCGDETTRKCPVCEEPLCSACAECDPDGLCSVCGEERDDRLEDEDEIDEDPDADDGKDD